MRELAIYMQNSEVLVGERCHGAPCPTRRGGKQFGEVLAVLDSTFFDAVVLKVFSWCLGKTKRDSTLSIRTRSGKT